MGIGPVQAGFPEEAVPHCPRSACKAVPTPSPAWHSWHSINRAPQRGLETSSAHPASGQHKPPLVSPESWDQIIPSERKLLSSCCLPGRRAWVSEACPHLQDLSPPSPGATALPVNSSFLNI